VVDLIPKEFRTSGLESYVTITNCDESWHELSQAWADDEFVLDPNRLTLHTGMAGIDGDTFKNKYLMDQFQIQVNKTSINSVLFMLTIGTTRSAVAYLLESLLKIAESVLKDKEDMSQAQKLLYDKKVKELTKNLPPLPNFSRFHSAFSGGKAGLQRKESTENTNTTTAHELEGDLRIPFFAAYEEEDTEYIPLYDKRLDDVDSASTKYVSANFVIPYPPGFPILVPGQEFSQNIIDFFRHLDVKEVHGYEHQLGLRVFKQRVLL